MNYVAAFLFWVFATACFFVIIEAVYQLGLDLLVAFIRYLDRRRDRRMGGE